MEYPFRFPGRVCKELDNLNRVQQNSCTLLHSVQICKQLETDLTALQVDENVIAKFKKCYSQAVAPVHLLAFLLYPRLKNFQLVTKERETAMTFTEETYRGSGLLPVIVKYVARNNPFHKYMFTDEVLNDVCSTVVEVTRKTA
ncbi:hypothetical protein PR048_004152, partial [Dryococelus australis]